MVLLVAVVQYNGSQLLHNALYVSICNCSALSEVPESEGYFAYKLLLLVVELCTAVFEENDIWVSRLRVYPDSALPVGLGRGYLHGPFHFNAVHRHVVSLFVG